MTEATKTKKGRRLSGVIKQDAADSGVANLIGANEVAGGSMKAEIAALRAQIEAQGLSEQVKDSGNMSLKAEIKMLNAVLQQSESADTASATLEEVEEEEEEEEVPELEEVSEAEVVQTPAQVQQSRGEKKSRKAMSKMGLVPVVGINRVTMKKGRDTLIVFNTPDVFKAPTSETYIIFGEAKIEDMKNSPVQQAANQYRQQSQEQQFKQPTKAQASEQSDGDVDDTGVDPKDIDLVVGQSGCTRGQAVTALKNNDNDIVNAIMELTM